MNIYTIKAFGNYGGGMAVVAADDEQEAIRACRVIPNKTWHVRYDEPDNVECIVAGAPADTLRGVLSHFETGE